MVVLSKTLVGGGQKHESLLEVDALNVSDIARVNPDASFDRVFTGKTLRIRFFVMYVAGAFAAYFPPMAYLFTSPDSSFVSLNKVLVDLGNLTHPVIDLSLAMYFAEHVGLSI